MWRWKRNYSFFAARKKKKNERVCDYLQKLEGGTKMEMEKETESDGKRHTRKEKQRDGKRNRDRE
jgi:hypothetical protein